MTGRIFDIQRFCIHDGPGIRTAVFMKGCPLRCVWCHNPESQAADSEVMFYKEKCINCGLCKGKQDFSCQNGAKIICGKDVTADYILDEVKKDINFYKNSGGGVTISGGEPFFQYDFLLELLKKLKSTGLHTAVETCGFTSQRKLKTVTEYTDLFLFDYKETNPYLHKQFTGVDNSVILKNLSILNEMNKKIILRCPIIKGCNDSEEHFEGIASTANKYENILRIELEPYHNLGEGKSIALGKHFEKFRLSNEHEKNKYADTIQRKTEKPVKI